MITLKLYGLIRLESGIKEVSLNASTVKAVLTHLENQGIPKNELKGCVILINGHPANQRSKLTDGDVVQLMSPVAGG